MGSYELFAWREAMLMAQDMVDEFAPEHELTIGQVKQRYEAIPLERKLQFEEENTDLIADYLQKTESQRPGFLRKIAKNADLDTLILFRVHSIIAAIRSKDLLELRDRYRMVLAPGSGNRVTTAGAYRFMMEIDQLFSYNWPHEAFESMGIYVDVDE